MSKATDNSPTLETNATDSMEKQGTSDARVEGLQIRGESGPLVLVPKSRYDALVSVANVALRMDGPTRWDGACSTRADDDEMRAALARLKTEPCLPSTTQEEVWRAACHGDDGGCSCPPDPDCEVHGTACAFEVAVKGAPRTGNGHDRHCQNIVVDFAQ